MNRPKKTPKLSNLTSHRINRKGVIMGPMRLKVINHTMTQGHSMTKKSLWLLSAAVTSELRVVKDECCSRLRTRLEGADAPQIEEWPHVTAEVTTWQTTSATRVEFVELKDA